MLPHSKSGAHQGQEVMSVGQHSNTTALWSYVIRAVIIMKNRLGRKMTSRLNLSCQYIIQNVILRGDDKGVTRVGEKSPKIPAESVEI